MKQPKFGTLEYQKMIIREEVKADLKEKEAKKPWKAK